MKNSSDQKILVYLFGSLGDTLVAIPALRAIRRHFSTAELVMLQNTSAGNIVRASEVIPGDLVDRYLSYSTQKSKFRKIFGFYGVWRDLRREKFQAVVYLVISERPERSVSRDKLFFRSCGIRKFFGFHSFSRSELYPYDENKMPTMTDHEAVRKLQRLEIDGIVSNPTADFQQPLLTLGDIEVEEVGDWILKRRKRLGAKLIAIAPGCKTVSNLWPLDRFIEIGKKLIAEENCEIVIVGGKAEFDLGQEMIEAWGEGINAAGNFTVRESAALLSKCDGYIGLDTGTTHLAAAVDTQCFCIYGERNNPGHWYPLGMGHSVVHHAVSCAGCRLFECSVPGHPCMMGITSEAVWRELEGFVKALDNSKSAKVNVVSV